MVDILKSYESGEKFCLKVPGLDYDIELPFVLLEEDGQRLRIASFNLVGQIRLNQDLGTLLAQKIRSVYSDLEGIALVTVVEKALQLSQVAAHRLGIEAVAVAYNRIKPHMEAKHRPTIQVGVDSITSGGKFLAMYERDLNLLQEAERGIILIDDVVSTGGTILGMASLVEEMASVQGMNVPPPILGIFCVAQEGENHPLLPAPLTSLTTLPDPQIISMP
jgi:adenine phosphoribosyltransferase